MPRLMPAPYLRRACDMRATKGRRQPPPPPNTPPPPQRWGVKVGRGGQPPPPPPEDKAARWGGSRERVRDGPHDRARRKHAPCKPQRGGTGGANAGWEGRRREPHGKPPPPPAEGQVPRLVPAPCLRRAYARGRTARTPPPPPTPISPTHPGKGRGQRGDSEETWGGAEDRPKRRGERRVASGGGAKKKNPELASQVVVMGGERWSIRWTGP